VNLLQFRTAIQEAVAGSGVPIGEYHLASGEIVPAINAGNPPPGTTASGLEISINPSPVPEILPNFAGGSNVKRWQARIVNHDGAALDFEAVMDALFDRFFPAVPQYQAEIGEVAEQCLLSVLDDPADTG
jgi:hypothetical protein